MDFRARIHTLRRCFEKFAATYGDREKVVFPDASPTVRWTATDFDRETNRVAHGYRTCGLEPGDRIACIGVNTPAFVAALFGSMKAGLVPAPFNPRESGDRLAELGSRFDPDALVFDPRYEAKTTDILRDASVDAVVRLDDPDSGPDEEVVEATHRYEALCRSGESAATDIDQPPDVSVTRDDTAFVNWSTGTTGTPKGLVWTNEAAVHAGILSGQVREATHEDTRIVASTPGFMGWFYSTLPCFTIGLRLVFMEEYDPERYLHLIEEERGSWFGGVSTSVRMALNAGPERYDLSSVKSAFYAAEPMDYETIERVREEVSSTVFSLYAASEGAALTSLRSGNDDPRALSDHLPLVEARAVETREGEEKAPPTARVDPGERGELIIRTPARADRVFDDPEHTDKIFRDGWWYSDDIVEKQPDGTYLVVGRADDMIITGGINVFPQTIEESLAERADIDDAVVVGVPDEQWGQRVVGIVRAVDEASIDVDALEQHCLNDDRIPRHARPRDYFVWEGEFPRTPSNKIDRKALKQEIGDEAGDSPRD